MEKPRHLYHGSSYLIEGVFRPVLLQRSSDHTHEKPAVFATARKDVAALFMFPMEILASIGLEQDIAYICIWGTSDEVRVATHGGYLYTLPSEKFEKIGKEYEWQSFEEIMPDKVEHFVSVVDGMIDCDVQVYFIKDNEIMDQIVANKDSRGTILKKIRSENEVMDRNVRLFS